MLLRNTANEYDVNVCTYNSQCFLVSGHQVSELKSFMAAANVSENAPCLRFTGMVEFVSQVMEWL